MAASLAAPQRPFSSGSKNAGPRGMVPWGMRATSSPASRPRPRRGAARRSRCPARPGCRPWPWRAGPTTGASKTSFLPRKRTGRPRLGDRERHGQGVEVAPVVAHDDAAAVGSGSGRCRRCRSGRRAPARGGRRASAPAAARPRRAAWARPAGTSRCGSGQRRSVATGEHAGVGVDDRGVPDRRQQRDVVEAVGVGADSVEVDPVGRRPTPGRPRACPDPTRSGRRWCRRRGRRCRPVAGGDDVVEAERSAKGLTRS